MYDDMIIVFKGFISHVSQNLPFFSMTHQSLLLLLFAPARPPVCGGCFFARHSYNVSKDLPIWSMAQADLAPIPRIGARESLEFDIITENHSCQ